MDTGGQTRLEGTVSLGRGRAQLTENITGEVAERRAPGSDWQGLNTQLKRRSWEGAGPKGHHSNSLLPEEKVGTQREEWEFLTENTDLEDLHFFAHLEK